jgi:hypothetical protein
MAVEAFILCEGGPGPAAEARFVGQHNTIVHATHSQELPAMLSVQDAVKAAEQYATEVLPKDELRGLRGEEITMSDDQRYWQRSSARS